MKLDELLAAFSRTYNLADLSASEDGSYQLVFDETLNVECRREGLGTVVLIARLSQLPKTLVQARPTIEKVMQRAYGRMGSHRAILCLDQEHQLFVYQRLSISTMSAVIFSQTLSRFVNQAEEFLRLVQAPGS